MPVNTNAQNICGKYMRLYPRGIMWQKKSAWDTAGHEVMLDPRGRLGKVKPAFLHTLHWMCYACVLLRTHICQ